MAFNTLRLNNWDIFPITVWFRPRRNRPSSLRDKNIPSQSLSDLSPSIIGKRPTGTLLAQRFSPVSCSSHHRSCMSRPGLATVRALMSERSRKGENDETYDESDSEFEHPGRCAMGVACGIESC